MAKMKGARALFFLVFASVAAGGQAAQSKLVEGLCARTSGTQQFFAGGDDEVTKHPWHQYPSLGEVPRGQGDDTAITEAHNGKLLVTITEPTQDFVEYSTYCFGSHGDLLDLRFEVRTEWGWGQVREGVVKAGRLHFSSSHFFDAETDAPISKPQDADTSYMKPRIYMKSTSLPFYSLLKK